MSQKQLSEYQKKDVSTKKASPPPLEGSEFPPFEEGWILKVNHMIDSALESTYGPEKGIYRPRKKKKVISDPPGVWIARVDRNTKIKKERENIK